MQVLDAAAFIKANVTIMKMSMNQNGANDVMIEALETVCDYVVKNETKRFLTDVIKQAI